MSEASINDVLIPGIPANSPEESSVFAKRSSAFKSRIERCRQLEKAQEIRDNLLHVASKIAIPAKNLEQNLISYQVLRQVLDSENSEPIVGPFDRDTFGHPETLLEDFLQQYKTHKHDVAQQDEFPLLIQKIASLAEDLKEHTSTAWCEYIRGLKAQWEVDQRLFSTRSHLDDERKKQSDYIDLVTLFTNKSRSLPKTTEEFEAVFTLHKQLCQQREALKLEVPEDVNIFLKAVAGQGATLEMLTENVRTWLVEEDDLTRYRIKRL